MKQLHITTTSTTIMDMTAGSMAGLIALLLFTIFLILITIILVRYRRTGQEHKDRDSDEYRTVPLISVDPSLPRHVCCDSLSSPSKSCSCHRSIQGLSMKKFGKDEQHR